MAHYKHPTIHYGQTAIDPSRELKYLEKNVTDFPDKQTLLSSEQKRQNLYLQEHKSPKKKQFFNHVVISKEDGRKIVQVSSPVTKRIKYVEEKLDSEPEIEIPVPETRPKIEEIQRQKIRQVNEVVVDNSVEKEFDLLLEQENELKRQEAILKNKINQLKEQKKTLLVTKLHKYCNKEFQKYKDKLQEELNDKIATLRAAKDEESNKLKRIREEYENQIAELQSRIQDIDKRIDDLEIPFNAKVAQLKSKFKDKLQWKKQALNKMLRQRLNAAQDEDS